MILIISIICVLVIMNHWLVSISFLLIITPLLSIYLGSPFPSFIRVDPFIIVDNLSVRLILLTSWLTSLVLIARRKILHTKQKESLFLRISLIQSLLLIITFISAYWVVTYLFFEGSLIPTLFMILVWGHNPERLYARIYFLLYTVGASLPMIIAFLWILGGEHIGPRQWCLFSQRIFDPVPSLAILLILGFLVKLPIYVLHVWLPKAHVEAPVGGSMFLAGVLLKLGPYGIIRLFELYPTLKVIWRNFIGFWSLCGAVIGALICVRQTDIKSLVAYASVRHIGLTLSRICSNSLTGLIGAKIILIGHGLVRSALFALVNFYYERSHRRSLVVNHGLIHASPRITFWWCLTLIANAAVPPSLNFLREVYIYIGLISSYNHRYIISMLVIYSIITMLYRIIIYTRLHHGEVSLHLNYLWERRIYYSISFLLVGPAYLCIFIPRWSA